MANLNKGHIYFGRSRDKAQAVQVANAALAAGLLEILDVACDQVVALELFDVLCWFVVHFELLS